MLERFKITTTMMTIYLKWHRGAKPIELHAFKWNLFSSQIESLCEFALHCPCSLDLCTVSFN